MTGRFRYRIQVIKRRTGKYLTEEIPVKERWKDETETPFKRHSNTMATFELREYEQELIMIECEVHRSFKEMANGKAQGADDIPIGFFKLVEEEAN